jgi:hypothetical protein
MRRTALFISRLSLLFLILFGCWFGLFVVPEAPGLIEADILGVRLVQPGGTSVAISGHKFSCVSGKKDLLQCNVMISGRFLEMTVTISDRTLTGCRATYTSKVLNCTAGYDYGGKTGLTPYVYIKDDLGLSNQQVQKLRQANLVVNTREDYWLELAKYISFATAVFTTSWLCSQGEKQINSSVYPIDNAARRFNHQIMKVVSPFIPLSMGVLVFCLSYYFFFFSLLALVLID